MSEIEVLYSVEIYVLGPNSFELGELAHYMLLLGPGLPPQLLIEVQILIVHLNYSPIQEIVGLTVLSEVSVLARSKEDLSEQHIFAIKYIVLVLEVELSVSKQHAVDDHLHEGQLNYVAVGEFYYVLVFTQAFY